MSAYVSQEARVEQMDQKIAVAGPTKADHHDDLTCCEKGTFGRVEAGAERNHAVAAAAHDAGGVADDGAGRGEGGRGERGHGEEA
jgi:hypothetical protein